MWEIMPYESMGNEISLVVAKFMAAPLRGEFAGCQVVTPSFLSEGVAIAKCSLRCLQLMDSSLDQVMTCLVHPR
jgi:hypothetical protein